jgi:hypothetical protein
MDLRPYTCLFANCAFVDNPFSNRQLWVGHLEIEHGFGPTWEGIQCPLCLEHTENGKGPILTHFARHMEDIALAALPRGVDSDVESDSENSSRSDSFRGAETTLDKDIRGIGEWMGFAHNIPDDPEFGAISDKNEGTANMNSGPGIRREGQKEKSPNDGGYFDPVYGYFRDTDKLDVDLNSGNPRQKPEPTVVELQRAAKIRFPPPAPLMRNDDEIEVSDRPNLGVYEVESLIPEGQRRTPAEWLAEQGDQNRMNRLYDSHKVFIPEVGPFVEWDGAMRRSLPSIRGCLMCREAHQKVIESQILPY